MTDNTITEQLMERADAAFDEMKHIEDTWGSDRSNWPAGQLERYERIKTSSTRMMAEISDREAREERVEAIRSAARSNPKLVEQGSFIAPKRDGEATRAKSDPWATGDGDDLTRIDSPNGLASRARDAVEYAHGLSPASRSMLTEILDRDALVGDSAYVIALSSDAYRAAFDKYMRDPKMGHLLFTPAEREAFARVKEVQRTAWSLGSGGLDGVLMPLTLDPSVQLLNAGSTNRVRALARKVTTITRDWNGVVSQGVTAEILAEGAEASDATPALSRTTIATFKGAAYLSGSYEVFADTDAITQITAMIADARANQEATLFVTGNGSTEPAGVVTTVSATTGSTVTATTRGSFGIPDVYAVWDALTPRSRNSDKTAWLAHNSQLTRIRRFDQTGGTDLWVQLSGGTPPSLIGKPVHEASAMTSSTTTGSRNLICGDFGNGYTVADRIGTVLVEIPMLMGDNKRPTYSAGIAAYWRFGGKCVAPDSFRLLLE